jgi:hypothetical protein
MKYKNLLWLSLIIFSWNNSVLTLAANVKAPKDTMINSKNYYQLLVGKMTVLDTTLNPFIKPKIPAIINQCDSTGD